MKCLLFNLVKHCPTIQHRMKIVGMVISGPKATFLELSNLRGYVCVVRRTHVLYFPVHSKEFTKRMIPLLRQLYINRPEMEARLDEVLTIEPVYAEYSLPPCF
ncbi:hypothetical protein BDB01DRAFT_101658 [Pilobolus umbonatus]|nr:hypothetical protein BDB01DRAFT_101658 [Pilobolus umbonatus]